MSTHTQLDATALERDYGDPDGSESVDFRTERSARPTVMDAATLPTSKARTPPQIIGRDDELRKLFAALDAAKSSGRAIAVCGDPGIGKSVLLEATARHGHDQEYRVLQTTGVEAESQLPFAGLHELLRPVLELAENLATPQRRALLSAFGLEEEGSPELFLICLAALNLLTEVASHQPVAVIIDDVHWLDQPSLEAVAFLARRIRDDHIIVVGGVRNGYANPFLAATGQVLNVEPLDEESSRVLLGSTAAHLDSVEYAQVLELARGNPLALSELPGTWGTDSAGHNSITGAPVQLSTRLEQAFAGRLGELASPTRDALLIAATGSQSALSEILAAASALAGIDVGVDALETAAAAGLLTRDEAHIRFRHPLVRSAILGSESVHRRQQAHGALAAVLDQHPFRRTWHRAFAIIGPDDDVADELEHNHAISVRRGSISGAIAALERSAQLSSSPAVRVRRLLLAAQYAFGLGRADAVERLLAETLANPLTELEQARVEVLREAFHDGTPGDGGRVIEMCHLAQWAGEQDVALDLLLAAALRCWWSDTGPEARHMVSSVARQVAGASLDPRYVAVLAIAEPVECSELVDDLLGTAVPTDGDVEAVILLGTAAFAIGDPVRSLHFLDLVENRLRQRGQLGRLSHVLNMGLLSRLELGDFQRVAMASEEARVLALETQQPIWHCGALAIDAMAHGLRGDNPRAQQLADDVEEVATGGGLNPLLACVKLARGYGHLGDGNYEAAYHALRGLFDSSDPSFHLTERFHGISFLSDAAVGAGKRDDARCVIDELELVAVNSVSPTLRHQLDYARAVLADDELAEDHYVAALGSDLQSWPWLRGRLELAFGRWLRRQHRISEARDHLRSAYTALSGIGATVWVDQAKAELRAAGELTARRSGRPSWERLTPQELQIVRMAGDGFSNKQIGQQLYLSPRTVSGHLYRAFPKLGITSRSQIAARLRDL
ncbi:MAG: transcriptional regulator, LuxR family [Acidimicrobiaceae bacterium]|nr:transcriptional regulator, LuxR family [Acidimicrobiaceae bacterium]